MIRSKKNGQTSKKEKQTFIWFYIFYSYFYLLPQTKLWRFLFFKCFRLQVDQKWQSRQSPAAQVAEAGRWTWSTYERRGDGRGRQLVRQVHPEHGVAQQDAGLEGDACAAVEGQVEADHVHQHEEDAGDEETHHVQQGAPADQHLTRGTAGSQGRAEFHRNIWVLQNNPDCTLHPGPESLSLSGVDSPVAH